MSEATLGSEAGQLLANVFVSIEHLTYCVVRKNEGFACGVGGDIDIFCESVIDCTKQILTLTKDAAELEYEIRVTSFKEYVQTHVDFLLGDDLVFRIDLYGALPPYRKVRMMGGFFHAVISDRRSVDVKIDESTVHIWVQSKVDECILRYLEYHEYFSTRPDKVRHLDWVVESAESEVIRIAFLKRLHQFTAMPNWEPYTDSESKETTQGPRPSVWERGKTQLKWKLHLITQRFRGTSS